jgi:Tol biopolymer transport system component
MIPVEFDIVCESATGTIEVRTVTGGVDLDPNGYTVVVDEIPRSLVGRNGVFGMSVSTGDHRVALAGLTPNCTPLGEAQRTLEVTTGATSSTTFEVSCIAAPPMGRGKEVAFFRFRGYLDEFNHAFSDVYLMNVDGTGIRKVLDTPEHAQLFPAWTRDGVTLAFLGSEMTGGGDLSETSGTIYILRIDDAGGISQEAAIAAKGVTGGLAWSPDGTQLAFTHATPVGQQIAVTGTSAFAPKPLTSVTGLRQSSPSWSPDGKRILYEQGGAESRCGDSEIWVVDVASPGSEHPLANPSLIGSQPVWSPSGAKIALAARVGSFYCHLYIVDANGSHPTQLTSGLGDDTSPAWAPDNSKIAFVSSFRALSFFPHVYIVDADGSSLERLTDSKEGFDSLPAWRP